MADALMVNSCSTTHIHPACIPLTKSGYGWQWKHKQELMGPFQRVPYQTVPVSGNETKSDCHRVTDP